MSELTFSDKIYQAEDKLYRYFRDLEEIRDYNQHKVLQAFKNNKIGEEHFAYVSGYGHDDMGREALDSLFADIFKAENAIVRPHFVSGTHALSCVLYGLLRPGDTMVSVAGPPYDTLEEIIGIRGNERDSLKGHNVKYIEIPLSDNGDGFSIEKIEKFINKNTKLAFIQRSRGYNWRKSLSIEDIKSIINIIKCINPDCICFVDNCYGEFTRKLEPMEVGADIIAGSLIKNAGGGIVEAGGYIAGKEEYVHSAANRLTSPGIGKLGGSMLNQTRVIFQGVFMAPSIVCDALKGVSLAAQVFTDLGYTTSPGPLEKRTDIIQAIKLETRDKLISFCQTLQALSPVSSYVTPIPYHVPGYESEIIMAAGTFIEGSTIELSADGPLREPYIAYLQGGLNYSHIKIVINEIINNLP
jgi:cystathionine gamma-lyase